MTNGIIYILTNASMPNLVKVGKTKEDAISRAAQLSSATGVPTKFEVYKEYAVVDPDEAELFAHSILERVLGRPNSAREFFIGTPTDVASLLDDALSAHLFKKEDYTIADFESPLSRLNKKEFTLGCIEFESIFNKFELTEAKIAMSGVLQTAVGAYIACCYAKSKRPLLAFVLAPNVKNIVIEKAIKFAEAFESDPTIGIIHYIRDIE